MAKQDKIWREAIQRAVKRVENGQEVHRLDRLADKLVAQGLAGDISAIKEIGDRLDGKPAQAHVGDADETPIQHTVKFRWDD